MSEHQPLNYLLCASNHIRCPKCGGLWRGRTLTFGHSVERCPFQVKRNGAHFDCGAHVFILHVEGTFTVMVTLLSGVKARDRLIELLDPRTHPRTENDE